MTENSTTAQHPETLLAALEDVDMIVQAETDGIAAMVESALALVKTEKYWEAQSPLDRIARSVRDLQNSANCRAENHGANYVAS